MSGLIGTLRRWLSRQAPLSVLLLGCGLTLLITTSASVAVWYTGTEEFCSNACHEMGQLAKEYRESIHNKNRTGVRATCADCHLPKAVIPLYARKMGALGDLWGHFVTRSIDTPKKFEAKRYELARRVWEHMKSNDSRECRNCHNETSMEASLQSEKASLRHAKGKREGMTCIDCHFAISHREPEGPGPQELAEAKK